MCLHVRLTTVLTCLLPAVTALGGQLPPQFTLGKYVPADSLLYVHAVSNPEREWIDAQWAEVFDALANSGIDQDIFSMILGLVEDREAAEATLNRLTERFKAVAWGDLVAKEFVLSERLGVLTEGAKTIPAPNYFALARGKPGTTDANMAALVGIFKELSELSEDISVSESKTQGVEVWTLGSSEQSGKDIPLRLQLLRKADVIGLSFALETETSVLSYLAGTNKKPPIVASPRFAEAMKLAKTPDTSLVFFDAKVLIASLDKLIAVATEDQADDADNLSIIKTLLELADVLDFSIATVETEGRRELTHSVAVFQPEKMNSPVVRAFIDRKTFHPYDKYIPVTAKSFSLNGFVDLEILYDEIIGFIEQIPEEGPQLIEKWDATLMTLGFAPKSDLFSWFSGEMISMELPAAVVTPMSDKDSVAMFRVKDDELARQKIAAGIDWANAKLQAHGQMLMVTPADVKAEGFLRVTHPMLMAILNPVIGVKDGWMFIGTSPAAVNACLDVAAGNAPSIAQNDRFKAEGLRPSGPVGAMSFRDLSKLGEEMAGIVGILGMMGGLATAQIPADDPEAQKVKGVIQSIMSIVMKLSPVLAKVDFFSSSASITTRDGNIVRTEMVTTYKPPAPPAEEAAAATKTTTAQ